MLYIHSTRGVADVWLKREKEIAANKEPLNSIQIQSDCKWFAQSPWNEIYETETDKQKTKRGVFFLFSKEKKLQTVKTKKKEKESRNFERWATIWDFGVCWAVQHSSIYIHQYNICLLFFMSRVIIYSSLAALVPFFWWRMKIERVVKTTQKQLLGYMFFSSFKTYIIL
jgi:hypothetical protein